MKNYDNMLSRFHPITERHGQTDGQTDRSAISISCVSVLTRDKNAQKKASSWGSAQTPPGKLMMLCRPPCQQEKGIPSPDDIPSVSGIVIASDGRFAKNENDSIQCHKRFDSVQPTSRYLINSLIFVKPVNS